MPVMVVVAPLVDACLQHGLQMRVARVCKIFGSRLVDVVCAVLGLLVYSQFSINYLVRNPAGTLNTRKMSSSSERGGRKEGHICLF